ncbi:MAG TPA: M56 family metallopeptidase, partial [Ferruginibacter sp.]|nr:M56 family metallopeptidase [Ferruginibacter sp.]
MLPFSWYILKVIICSGILFGYYWLFLRNKIFHQYNRFYLLTALALSLSLPMLKIDFWQQYTPRQSQVIKALQVVSAGDDYMNNVMITANDNSWNMRQLYTIMYWAVSLVFLLVLIRTLFVIRSLLKKYPVQLIDKFSFVNTDDKSTPFSFLKYIFWNANIDMDTPTGKQIFKHEVAHIQEKHTYDKLLINITLIFFWCNPFFWLYRKELNMIHEFIADKKAVEDCDTAAFAEMILQATYPQHRFQLTNNFFYSPIKRRLLMLTKNNNPKISYGARLMVLPLAVLVFTAFSFKVKDTNKKLKSTVLIPVHDTIPARSVGLQAEQIPAIEEIDPKKALLVVNGKIIGKGAENDAVFNQLYAAVVNVAWLQKKAALAKYGNEGAEG